MSTSSSSVGAWSPTASWRPSAPATPRPPTASRWSPRRTGRPTTGSASAPSSPARPRRTSSSGTPRLWDDPSVTLRLSTTATGIDRAAGVVTTADGGSHAYDHLVLATGSYAWVPPVPGADRHGRLRLPHHRRRRRPARLGRAAGRPSSAARSGARSWAVACSGWRPPGALVGLEARVHRRRVRAAAHGPAGRRGRWPRAAPDHRGDGRRRPRSARAAESIDRGRSRSGRRAARRRRRGGPAAADVVVFATGRAAARRAGRARRAGHRSARRCRRRRGLPHGGPAGLRDRRGRLHRGALPGARRPRATRWPRSPSTGCSAATRPSRAPTCRPSSSCSASTSPRSATRSRRRPARSSSCTPTRSPGCTRSSSSPTTPARCWAASSSATRRRTRACGRWWAPSSAATRACGSCRRTPVPSVPRSTCPTQAAVCSCNNVTAGAVRVRGLREGLPRRRRPSRRARGPARRAARASRSSRS